MHYNEYRALGFTNLANGLLAYYPQLKITDPEIILIIQLEMFAQKCNKFPSDDQIAANTNFSPTEVTGMIQQLIEKNDLEIDQVKDEKGRIGNRFNLEQLYEKLDKLLDQKVVTNATNQGHIQKASNNVDNSPLNQLRRQFEIEFGRYLTPIEREELAAWLNVDHYDPEIIKLALREAVLSQAYSMKYVDRVLLNWQRHNLKTSGEVQQFLQRNR